MSWFIVLRCQGCSRFYGLNAPRRGRVYELRAAAKADGWTWSARRGDRCPGCSA